MRKSKNSIEISPGTRVLDLIVGPNIGKGAFGEIYSSIDIKTGILWALKTESNKAKKKTLQFEYQILSQVQSSPYFPRLGFYGKTNQFSFFSMEWLGPSLTSILKHYCITNFCFSTSLRSAYCILKCIESFHSLGFVHRDIKPGNILTREGSDHPLCLIDFGLSRVYVNPSTGQHLQPRKHVGFRGTRAYASINAHEARDLSRRDDLISWFYITYEFLITQLPWRHETDKNQILIIKRKFDIKQAVEPVLPELYEIWQHISGLSFFDAPNYNFIYHKLTEIARNKDISFSEPLEWSDYLHQCRRRVTSKLRDIEARTDIPILGVENSEAELDSIDMPLIRPNITVAAPFSQISEEEPCCLCCPC